MQIEDGVGAIRLLKESFKSSLKKMKKKLKTPSKITVATASTPYKLFKEFQKQINVKGLNFEVLEVENKFFGSKINVAGLITASDIIDCIKDKDVEHLVIPSVMLKKNSEGVDNLFLDGLTTDDLIKSKKGMKLHVQYDCYSFDEMLNLINSL